MAKNFDSGAVWSVNVESSDHRPSDLPHTAGSVRGSFPLNGPERGLRFNDNNNDWRRQSEEARDCQIVAVIQERSKVGENLMRRRYFNLI